MQSFGTMRLVGLIVNVFWMKGYVWFVDYKQSSSVNCYLELFIHIFILKGRSNSHKYFIKRVILTKLNKSYPYC